MSDFNNRKLRILYLVSTLERKGPTNQLLYIISHLDKSKFEPLVVTLSKEGDRSMREEFDVHKIKVISLATGRFEGIFKNKQLIQRIIDEFRPHLIQSQGIRADGYNASYTRTYKALTTARNVPDYDYPNKFGRLRGGLMAQRHINIFRKLNVVACSEAISEEYTRFNIPTIAIQNGVDVQKFSPAANSEKQMLKKQVGLSNINNVFITVGSLIPRKNLQVLIKAFNHKTENDVLLIVGSGSEKAELSQLVTTDNIIFQDFTPNIVDYFCASDCYIASSLSEGLPNSVMEAMASGLPVVLSDIEPHRELVKNSVFEEFLFDATNHDDVISKIALFKSYYNTDFGKESRKIAVESFSAQSMSNKYQQLYINLICNHAFQL